MANQQTRRGNLRGIQLKPSLNAINCADFELLRHVYGWDYGEALKRVAGALGGVVVPTPNQVATRAEKPAQGKIDAQTAAAVWSVGFSLSSGVSDS